MKRASNPLAYAIWLVQQRWHIAGCLQLLRGA
jgi:hypothetical protein